MLDHQLVWLCHGMISMKPVKERILTFFTTICRCDVQPGTDWKEFLPFFLVTTLHVMPSALNGISAALQKALQKR